MKLAAPIYPRAKPRARYVSGPYTGMRDSRDPSSSRPELARLLRNCYPTDPQFGGAINGRPGFTLSGEGGGQQGGSGGARTGQLVYQLTKLDGTEVTFRIVGGKIDTYDWGADTWTNSVTAANLTTASITLSTTARCYAVTFADTVVVSDGVNQPWTWDGTAGAGGLTPLTNAPVAFGPPTVYYAKLFFIKSTERSTLVWSEENTPNTGYEAGGYNNAWTLGQTDQEAFFSLHGTNEALYCFRARSTTAITGAVTPDFASTGTREGVSETEGTTAPASVFSDGRRIYFTNADGQPHMILPGAGVLEIWTGYRETILSLDPMHIDDCEGFFHPPIGLAALAFTERGETRRSVQLTYHSYGEIPQAAGLFAGYTFDRAGVVKDSEGVLRVMHLDAEGYAYFHGDPDIGPWSDDLQSGAVAIAHAVDSGYLGGESFDEKHWDRLDIAFRLATDLTSVFVRYDTPRGVSTQQTTSLDGSFARWDEAIWDTDEWSSAAADSHLAVGLNGNGRWLVWRVQHETAGEQFGLSHSLASASVAGPFPGTP